jgi:hypothetical protein
MAIAVTVVLGIGWSAFMISIGHATSASPTTTTASTMAARAVETYAASLPPTSRATTTTTAIPTTTIKGLRDGTLVVGTDIEPGTYRSTSTESCYWARLRSFSGTGNNIIANEFVTSGTAIVTIQAGDVGFKSERCGPWERIG